MNRYDIIHELALRAATIVAENKYKTIIDENEDNVISDFYRVYTKAVEEYDKNSDDSELPIGF